MKRAVLAVVVLSMAAGVVQAASLCRINPFTRADAQQGKLAFDSHCGLCHQYSMVGREPGNYQNESPDMKLLSEGDWKFLENGGGAVPPLVGPKFFDKYRNTTLVDFAARVGGAANSFPPNAPQKMNPPQTYFQLTAYVLYRNCGLL